VSVPGAAQVSIGLVETAKMIMTAAILRRLQFLLAGCFACAILVAFGVPAHAQTVVVMVNGDPITEYDIEQRSKLDLLSTHKQSPRQDVVNQLIDDKVKIKEAKKYGVDPSSSDVDQAYGEMATRMRITSEQLDKTLEAQGIRPETLKARVKADLVWGSLVRGRYKERLQVGEKDVEDKVRAEGGDAQQQGQAFEYRLQPVMLIVPRGSAPAVMEARQKEAEALRVRVQTCEEASNYFKTMQNAAVREPVVKTSADLPEPLRKVLDDTPVGHLTPPEVTKDGISMVALCGRKATSIDSPRRKEMRDKIYAQKYETTSDNYLKEIRKAAMIEYRCAANRKPDQGKKSASEVQESGCQ
jgi:peptidyl-prolyl cis-trans isomerase SurA